MADYVLVPRVATAEMHRASVEDVPVYPAMGERWKAMLAARPPVDYDALASEIRRRMADFPGDDYEALPAVLREVLL